MEVDQTQNKRYEGSCANTTVENRYGTYIGSPTINAIISEK